MVQFVLLILLSFRGLVSEESRDEVLQEEISQVCPGGSVMEVRSNEDI